VRVLIACEFSGVVRDAFAARGHDAWSCDLLPSERPGQHFAQDVLPVIEQRWDLIIGHPPCTYLCNSGVRWLAPKGVLNKKRHDAMILACDFFAALWYTSSMYCCIENPIIHKYARDYLFSAWKICLPAQRIQPYEYGHPETKKTCLWLRGLPRLEPTNIVAGRTPRVHHASPGVNRWKERSRTLPGIAAAMAEQWGNL
jgi:hypothetical protein